MTSVSLTCPVCYGRLTRLGRGDGDKWVEVNAYRCQRCEPGANRFRVENGVMVGVMPVCPVKGGAFDSTDDIIDRLGNFQLGALL